MFASLASEVKGRGMSSVMKRVVVAVIGVGVAAGVAAEWVVRDRLERRYQAAIETRRQLELQFAELRADRDRLADAVSRVRDQAEALTRQLDEKDRQLQVAVDRLTQEERIIRDLQEKLLATERQFNTLQGELAAALEAHSSEPILPAGSSQEGMVQLEKVVVATAPATGELQGHVVSVHSDWRFVVIDLGWDAVKIGDVVSIYHQEQLLGKARVERVQEQVSAATLLPESNPTTIQVNDVVRLL